MKLQVFILAIGLIVAFTFGAASSDELADNVDLRTEVRQLRDEVSKLRRQVDFLMIDYRPDKTEVEALAERVRFAKEMQSRAKLLRQVGPGGSELTLHRSNTELRLAQARLAFAKQDYETALDHLDAAVAASKADKESIERLRLGPGNLSALIDAEKSVLDTELERRRTRKRIEVLTASAR